MSHIHFIGGEKGGVGKSVTARVISQWAIDRGLPFAAADADVSHATLARTYSEYTQTVDLESFASADQIVDRALAQDRRVVVDLPSQSVRQLARWFESADIVRFARETGVALTLWHVTDGGFDSVGDLTRLLTTFKDGFGLVVVRNLGRSRDFSQFDGSEARATFEARGGRVIDLPELDGGTMHKIDRFGTSFWSAVNHSEGEWVLSPMERQRARAWLTRCYAQLDSLGDAL